VIDLASYHEEMPSWVEGYLERYGLAWRSVLDNSAALPAKLISLAKSGSQIEAIVKAIIWTDPVAWVECTLVETDENGGGFWRLYPKQRSMLTAPCDLIVKGASEIGKTRVMAAEGLFSVLVLQQDALIAGHNDSLGEEIFDLLDQQIASNPLLRKLVSDDDIKQKPRRTLRAHGAKLTYTTVGPTGKPLRGFHINGRVLGDECAEWEPKAWIQFWRAGLKTCRFRVMSMPNGLTDSEFYKLYEAAVPFEDLEKPAEHRGLARLNISRWETPWYTKPRDDQAVSHYHGRDTSAYQQNVLGLDGDPENVVFNKDLVQVAAARGTGSIHLSVAVVPKEQSATIYSNGCELERDAVDQQHFDAIASEIAALIQLPAAQYVIGGDFGFHPDPSELFVLLDHDGVELELVLRVTMEHASYPLQVAIYLSIIEKLRPAFGVGLDATGAGLSPAQSIALGMDALLMDGSSHVSAWQWHATHHDHLEESLGCTLKEKATQLLEEMLRARTMGLSRDKDTREQMENLRAKKGRSGRSFRGKDHCVDALLAAVLRWHAARPIGSHIPPMDEVQTFSHSPAQERPSI